MKKMDIFLDNEHIDYECSIIEEKLFYSINTKDLNGQTISIVYDENIFETPKFASDVPIKTISKYKIEIPVDKIKEKLTFSIEANYKYFVKTVFDYMNETIDTETLIQELKTFIKVRSGKKYERQISEIIKKIESPSLEDMILESDNEFKRVGKILIEDPLYCELESSMSALDMLLMITYQLFCPSPFKVSQEFFDEMVQAAIDYEEATSENIWRLGLSYDGRGYDYDSLDSYFVNKKDSYFLAEYISGIEQVDQVKIVDMVLKTDDKKFIEKLLRDNFIQAHLEERLYKKLQDYLKAN